MVQVCGKTLALLHCRCGLQLRVVGGAQGVAVGASLWTSCGEYGNEANNDAEEPHYGGEKEFCALVAGCGWWELL